MNRAPQFLEICRESRVLILEGEGVTAHLTFVYLYIFVAPFYKRARSTLYTGNCFRPSYTTYRNTSLVKF